MSAGPRTTPHLSGNYLPVAREVDAANLQVISGRIPPGLSGAYMRNGPNPHFKPISYAYPMDGDGMIHAVYFDNGRARYRNRFVKTSGFETEQRAGRAIYGSFTHPVRSIRSSSPGAAIRARSRTVPSSASCATAVTSWRSTKQPPAMN